MKEIDEYNSRFISGVGIAASRVRLLLKECLPIHGSLVYNGLVAECPKRTPYQSFRYWTRALRAVEGLHAAPALLERLGTDAVHQMSD